MADEYAMSMDRPQKGWVAADYAAWYERRKRHTQREWHFNLLVETIAEAMWRTKHEDLSEREMEKLDRFDEKFLSFMLDSGARK